MGVSQKETAADRKVRGQPNVAVRIEKKKMLIFFKKIIWKYFQSNVNLIFEYSVLDN